VLRALPAIALGHALSVAIALLLLSVATLVIPARALQFGVAALLLGFAVYLLVQRRSHPRWAGMRMGFKELVFWSFLMTTAHGAGLMLFPVLMRDANETVVAHAHAAHTVYASSFNVLAVHSLVMLTAMAAAALVTFHVLGVSFLRRAWVNLDAVWIGALVVGALWTLAAI
jgi:hypothetical protein